MIASHRGLRSAGDGQASDRVICARAEKCALNMLNSRTACTQNNAETDKYNPRRARMRNKPNRKAYTPNTRTHTHTTDEAREADEPYSCVSLAVNCKHIVFVYTLRYRAHSRTHRTHIAQYIYSICTHLINASRFCACARCSCARSRAGALVRVCTNMSVLAGSRAHDEICPNKGTCICFKHARALASQRASERRVSDV